MRERESEIFSLTNTEMKMCSVQKEMKKSYYIWKNKTKLS